MSAAILAAAEPVKKRPSDASLAGHFDSAGSSVNEPHRWLALQEKVVCPEKRKAVRLPGAYHDVLPRVYSQEYSIFISR